MPQYGFPGAEVGPRRARMLGLGTVLLVAVVWSGLRAVPDSGPEDAVRVTLVTERVGAGVETGTDVRVDGVRVGKVAAIAVDESGHQRIELGLEGSQLVGLTDTLGVDYVPSNLFGITALQLRSGVGGAPLRRDTVIDLTSDSARERDATLSTLLRSTGQLTDDVLTPALTDLLDRTARDLEAFLPLLEAIAVTARAVSETRQLPTSVLLDQFGSALAGLPPMLTGGMGVLYSIYTNDYFEDPEQLIRYGDTFSKVQTQLLPSVTRLLGAAGGQFATSLPVLTVLLDAMSSSVGTPERSHGELGELLDRLDAAFRDTPTGPALAVRAELSLAPGLAIPLRTLVDSGYGAPGSR
ncbi:MlaD family protein [Nocardia sp. NPDC055053]